MTLIDRWPLFGGHIARNSQCFLKKTYKKLPLFIGGLNLEVILFEIVNVLVKRMTLIDGWPLFGGHFVKNNQCFV